LDKYLFQANVRRDGSSVFAPGRHYGVFPAFSAGWRISEESFMENLAFVSSIKLRAGWGQLGNANIPSYAWISTLAVDGGYVLGNSQARYPAYFIEDMTNEDVKWETTTTTDVGIDFSLFDGAVSFVGDIYEKKTTDMLLRGTIPQSAGFSNGPIINIGEVKNKGWEMQLTYQNRFNELNTALSFNLSQNKSEITDLGGVTPWIEEGVLKYDEGLELGTFWGYQVEGIWQNHDEIRNNAHRPNDRPGMYRYADLNGYDDEGNLTGQPDGIINDADKTILGSYSPSFIYGFNMEFDYKGFDFSAFFQGEADKFLAISSNDGANGEGENENIPQYYFDNRSILDANGNVVSGSLPASGAVTDDGLWDSSEIQNVSYLRLKNIQLGYSLPKPLISKLALKNVRIYLNATNLLTWTDFVGYDPEFKGGEGGDGAVSDSGIDFYPLHKTIGGGLQITF
ncbi:MAG TPA: SusC/RagA family TonB-linked outer membrane protein, partial [Mariniphaga anaerophila]|nr:SusC/RagA family TonB-linked outer membrane protein [Mariniphaga anaerophila]